MALELLSELIREHNEGIEKLVQENLRRVRQLDNVEMVLASQLDTWAVQLAKSARSCASSDSGTLMRMTGTLSATITLREFENGYWYLDQLKEFAGRVGIPAAKRLRKDELEKAIVTFLRTGEAALPTNRSLRKTGMKDVERGLSLDLAIQNYTSNRATKDFIVQRARAIAPEIREKSGVWYRLNRWRDEQITNGNRPTYGNLVRQYIALNKTAQFEKIPHGRYINFVSEFRAFEKGATHREAVAAWTALKALDVPKDYASWVKVKSVAEEPSSKRLSKGFARAVAKPRP